MQLKIAYPWSIYRTFTESLFSSNILLWLSCDLKLEGLVIRAQRHKRLERLLIQHNQMLAGTDLLQIGRLDHEQIAQRIQNSEQSVHNGTIEVLGAEAILVDVSDDSHGAQLVVLESEDVVVNAAVEFDAQLFEGTVDIAAVQARVELGDLVLDYSERLGTRGRALVGNLVGF
jgi:hypothetical protein